MSQRCAGEKNEWWPFYYYVVIVIVSGVNFAAFAVCFYAEVSMLLRKAIRSNTFDLYVIFMLLPDALNNLIYFLHGAFRASDCSKVSPLMSDVSDANVFFYYMSNFALNCLVAYELYALLERSHRGIRSGPPPVKKTLRQVAAVYTFALLFTAWAMVDAEWSFWYRKKSKFGSPPGGVFNKIQAVGMCVGLMLGFILFVIAIRIQIWRKQLTPKRGRTRVVTLFFQHIINIFLFFYFPSIGLVAFSTQLKSFRSTAFFWMERSRQVLAALQALATVCVAARKPDIHKALCCGRDITEKSSGGNRWSVFDNRRSTGRRTVFGSDGWVQRFSVFRTGGGVGPAAAVDATGRTAASATHRPPCHPDREDSPMESSRESRNSDVESSEWFMNDVYDTRISSGVDGGEDDVDGVEEDGSEANKDAESSEWLMDDVYDTQISSAVDGADNDVKCVEEDGPEAADNEPIQIAEDWGDLSNVSITMVRDSNLEH